MQTNFSTIPWIVKHFKVRLIIFKCCRKNFLLLQNYIGWIRMKRYCPTNFPSIFLTVTENKLITWKYSFSGSTSICLLEFNNNNCRINRIRCKICSKLIIGAPDVVLVSLLLTSTIFDVVLVLIVVAVVNFKNANGGWNILLPQSRI